ITYSWSQVSGPTVTLATPTAARTTFTAAVNQTYVFRLTVTDAGGLSSSATTRVSTTSPTPATVIRFDASPSNITAGQSSTLSWTSTGASTVSISGVGAVTLNGSTTVTPQQTTTYTLTATSADGKSVTAPITITVTTGTIPQIVVFVATPQTIDIGSSTKL